MENAYEIHDLTTNEILVDNLNFKEVSELFDAYTILYPTHEIEACYRSDSCIYQIKTSRQDDFKAEWFALVEEHLTNFY